jgi:ethanolamine utilization cobalamin adenosyltransferase
MMVITESELREFWKNGRGQMPSFPAGTRFSASAQDFIKTNHIELRYTPDAPAQPDQSQITVPSLLSAWDTVPGSLSAWDKPGTFPVVLTGPVPVCLECGQPLHSKPEHMTQLDAGHFAPKTNPRLVFRGRVDSLHALVMLTASMARRFELPELAQHLDTLAAYCREVMSAEYNLRPAASLTLLGKNAQELHEISHWPEKYLGIPHLVPGPYDHEILHWLNMLRTQSREVEIIALQAFPLDNTDPGGVGSSITLALNRLSSAVYVLELYFQAGKLNWKVTGENLK